MATTLVFAIALIFQHGVESIETPYGLCFVPTKHTEARGELSTPLISPQSPGYKQAYNDFIEPMLKEISDTTGIFTKGAKNRLRSIKDNIEVYYSDNSQDRMFLESIDTNLFPDLNNHIISIQHQILRTSMEYGMFHLVNLFSNLPRQFLGYHHKSYSMV